VSEDLTTELVSTVIVLAAETSLTFTNTIASSDTTARVKFLLIIPPPCPETIF
jgi:hypothetical protein